MTDQEGQKRRRVTSRKGTSLADELAEEIQMRIVSGEIEVDTWLRQESLGELFGVSRTPVREALRKLQASDYLEIVPNRGALVRAPDPDDIADTYLVRADLEGLVAELAAGLARPNDVRRLTEAFDDMATAVEAIQTGEEGDGKAIDWIHTHNAFHSRLVEIANNQVLAQVVEDLHARSPRSLVMAAIQATEGGLEENLRRHAEILRCVRERRPLEARGAMKELILDGGDEVVRWLS